MYMVLVVLFEKNHYCGCSISKLSNVFPKFRIMFLSSLALSKIFDHKTFCADVIAYIRKYSIYRRTFPSVMVPVEVSVAVKNLMKDA